jgi:uncharacterized protein YeaO (DUF488 family)
VTISIVQLGTPRAPNEGPRLGTVRRPPRGVRKADYAKRDFFDVWLPNLSPSQPLVSAALASDSADAWNAFARRFRAEMKKPEASHLLDTLALLSHSADFSVGCYCDDESRCHRSLLRELLVARGARVA